MMRWLFPAMTVVGLLITFLTRSAGVLTIGLVLFFVGAFGTLIVLVSERIADRSRPDTSMLSAEELAALHKKDRPRRNGTGAPSRASEDS